ncbi:tRNA (adenosine(37)-N6)-threonylcarbamoyltransferase complex dimerization subunit type 1 TsaB [Pseudonocardia sp.]|uniref:tRNA (adenosine(37)-N6)-threonylcarbamoyltransferase complex dimerization subunit type 1 TsaB n=1 Tax=Pseudonocardia sp. TaxID=60912 RepID=UPI0026083638|nr:tRNA (adenosine(37)-N6)-threonylcarbamoyltransferase complex dimerization subunit type 1 TsaB [Pseudonocardia sp.]
MLVLALDTATPAVTAGVVELAATGARLRSCRVAHDPRKHGELLMPGVLAACAEAGIGLREVDAVVTGAGPGPFTGLRVGMVTAATLGDALGVPVHGVCTLDAIARDAGPVAGGNLLVATDARRREVYWAAYDPHATRLTGPHVERPAALVARIAELGVVAAAGGSAEGLGLPVREPGAPSPAGLVAVAADALRAGTVPGPLEPLYLRRPDAAEPGPRKAVSTP